MAILDFSVSGRYGFDSVTQVCFGISVPNFMCMSFVAVGRSLMIVSYVAFKMVALWFWTMFNCNLPIAHCHPLLWGGGILVDRWSTISSIDIIMVISCLVNHLKLQANHKWVAHVLKPISAKCCLPYSPFLRVLTIYISNDLIIHDGCWWEFDACCDIYQMIIEFKGFDGNINQLSCSNPC